MELQKWTKILSPNHYKLTDWWICKKCKIIFKEELGEQVFKMLDEINGNKT